jgi:hypothetical protein
MDKIGEFSSLVRMTKNHEDKERIKFKQKESHILTIKAMGVFGI